jgi:hypothetical protein
MRTQRGISYWGVVALIFVAFFGLQFFLAVGSAYMDDFTINKIVQERLAAEPNEVDPATLMNGFDQQFDMNGIRDVKAESRLKVVNDGGIEVVKDYEVRHNFIGNIDLVVHFQKTFNQKAIKAG